ncbi:MAG: hypothetical protein LUF27_10010 [Lachnospiraceae bacterium]|nr:hypothetical protein [Lachnospiraceae bacterium]
MLSKSMKKRATALVLAAAVAAGSALPVNAAPSISEIIPENPVVQDESLAEGQELIVQNADTSAYADQTVAEVVENFNDDNTTTTIKEVIEALGVDTTTNQTTESGKAVNATLYEAITAFVDLAIKESDGTVHYNSNGSITATVTIEAAKDREASNLLIIQIDPNTGKTYFVTIDELNSETGEVTATFPTLGAIALAEKVPIVVKNTSPELYDDEVTAEVITEFQEESQDITLYDVLKSLTDKTDAYDIDFIELTEELERILTEQIEVAENVVIDVADYTSAMGFADMAIKYGKDEDGNDTYSYNMDGSLIVDAYRDIEYIDWARIVTYGYEDYDTEAAENDLSLLTELDPFVLEDCFVMQINSVTGEINFIYEPVVYFTTLSELMEEETEVETEAETEALTEAVTEAVTEEETEAETEAFEDNSLLYWTVEDEDKVTDEETPVLAIQGEFEDMGPFAIFMPEEGTNSYHKSSR